MGIYQFSEEERKHLEQMPTSLVVYQYADGKVYPLVVSDGYREMFRLPDREETYRLLSEDVLWNGFRMPYRSLSQKAASMR